jgi:peptidyl-prolyl cis-trans isomerase D
MRKLEELVASSAKVSDNEVRQVFEQTNQKFSYSYVLVRPLAFHVNRDSIPEQELRAYYDKNKEEFRLPEAAKLRYLTVPKKPSARDESDVLTSANDIWRELRAGTDFAEMATTFSEGPEAKQGGDVGALIPRTSMTPEFANVAFSLKVGEVSSPFKDNKGFHIIRVEEKKTEDGVDKVRYRHILLPISAGSETLAETHNQVLELASKASKSSLDQAAKEMGFETRETNFFTKDGISPVLPQDAAVREFPFKNKVGDVGKPVETQRGWVVFEVADKRAASLPSFEEALQSVKMAVVRAKQDELASRKIETVAEIMSRGVSMEQAAAAGALSVERAEDVGIYEVGSAVSKEPAMIGAALALAQGQTSPVVKGAEGFFILRLDNRTAFDEQLYQSQKQQLRAQLFQQKRMIAASIWMEQLRGSAQIEDYRAEVLGF